MLITDLAGVRRLFEATPREYYSVDVTMIVEGSSILPPFTGKVVKSLLILGSGSLTTVFESGYTPKPISISPLYRIIDGRREYMWKKAGGKQVMELRDGDIVGFHVGFTEEVRDKVVEALNGIDGARLFNIRWNLKEYELNAYRLPLRHRDIPRRFRADIHEYVKVEFRSPALFLDPYKKSRIKRFLPLPGIVFSYNVGELLRLERNRDYVETIDHLNALLNEPYTILETVKPVKYVYDGLELPGVTGYAKYMIDYEYMVITESIELLENILIHASIMGVGTSRANGFGYVTIKLGGRRKIIERK